MTGLPAACLRYKASKSALMDSPPPHIGSSTRHPSPGYYSPTAVAAITMHPSPTQIPSPCSTVLERPENILRDQKGTQPSTAMLKIKSLLNPADHGAQREATGSPPLTPAYTQASSMPSTPSLDVAESSVDIPAKRQKLKKDQAIFVRGTATQPVIYKPTECIEEPFCLNTNDTEELARQHREFAIFPSGRGEDGLIADYQRHIPYSSDKKAFFGKTNRDAFEVFQYTFRMPGEPNGKDHVVMWDYQVGLVRITPFFKALKYPKTTPAKALTANPGLKELSHSITGGALAAQGYWMPYSCARAICLTFCYDIRWALTPIFGHSFVRECLRPDNPGFGRYKVSSEVIRCAQLEAEGLRAGDTPLPSPAGMTDPFANINNMPRSEPSAVQHPRPLRPRPTADRSTWVVDSDSEESESGYTYAAPAVDLPGVSPKTTRQPFSPSWASVNRAPDRRLPPPPPHNTPAGSLSYALLTEPRTFSSSSSWYELDKSLGATRFEPASTLPKRASKWSSQDANRDDGHGSSLFSTDADGDIAVADAPTNPPQLSQGPVHSPLTPQRTKVKGAQSTKYTAADARAAHLLITLSARDSQMAMKTMAIAGQKRRAETS